MSSSSSSFAACDLHSFQDLEQSFPRQKVDLPNGETLSYVDCRLGDEHTLLVVPGYGCDSKYMAYTLAQFGAFQNHRIVSVDPRGYGESTHNQENWSHEQNADDIKLFMDQLGPQTIDNNKPIMILGYSTGGGAAAWMALKHPQLIKAVWMMSALPLDGMRTPVLNEKLQLTGELLKTKQDARDYVRYVMEPGTHNPDIEKFRAALSIVAISSHRLPPTDHDSLRTYHTAAIDHVSRSQALYANNTFNVTPIQTPTKPPTNILSNLQCPMIVMHGTNDVLIKAQHVRSVTELAIVERWAPNKLLSYYEIPSCGHLFMYDNPEEFQETYLRALDEQVVNPKKKKKNKGRIG